MTTAIKQPSSSVKRVLKMPARTFGRLKDSIPKQGEWTLAEYDFFMSRLSEPPWMELADGRLVEKSMPSFWHSIIARNIFKILDAFVEANKLGYVFFDGTEFRISQTKVRIPDLLFVSHDHVADREEMGLHVVDIAIEILSPSTRKEDLGAKRGDYAFGKVAEYWIVDPEAKQIKVLKLSGAEFVADGEYGCGEQVQSELLKGFSLDVSGAFAGLKD